MKKALLLLISFVAVTSLQAGTEILKNGHFTEWNQKGLPKYWHSKSTSKDLSIVHGDNPSAKVSGRVGQLTTRIKLKKDTHYRVSGWIYKAGSGSHGSIGLRAKDYKWLLMLKGSKKTGDWQKVSTIYKATGNEFYFYCINWYIGKEEACFYSTISVEELTPEEVEAAKKEEK